MSELELTIEQKVLKNGENAFILMDSRGYICGIHATAEDAVKAAPCVKWNINRGRISKGNLARLANSKNSKQLSTKK